jgi:hypothetical protein
MTIQKTIGIANGTSTLQGWWRAVGNVADSINGNDAVWDLNTYPPYYGPSGNVFSCDVNLIYGYSRHVHIPYIDRYNFVANSEWSISCEAKLVYTAYWATYTNSPIIGNTVIELSWYYTAVNTVCLKLTTGTGTQTYSGIIDAENWHNYEIRFNSGRFDVFVNGIQLVPDAYHDNNVDLKNDISFGYYTTINCEIDEIKIYSNAGDYPDINSALYGELDGGGLSEDVVLTQISSFDNTTADIGGFHQLNGFTIELVNPNPAYTVTCSVRVDLRTTNVGVAGGTLKAHGFNFVGVTGVGMVALLTAINNNGEFYNNKIVGDGSQAGLLYANYQGCLEKVYNNRISACLVGMNTQYTTTGGSHTGYKIFVENNVIHNCDNGLTFYAGTGTYSGRIFKNNSVSGSSVADYSITQLPIGAFNEFVNCADGDNSLTVGIDTVHGITDLDFLSVVPGNDFLKIGLSSALYKKGTPLISAWNTEDIDGNPRPDSLGRVSIGVYEPGTTTYLDFSATPISGNVPLKTRFIAELMEI